MVTRKRLIPIGSEILPSLNRYADDYFRLKVVCILWTKVNWEDYNDWTLANFKRAYDDSDFSRQQLPVTTRTLVDTVNLFLAEYLKTCKASCSIRDNSLARL
jgi:hypothetical protein